MKEKNQFEPSIKIYHVIIVSVIFSVLFFNKMNKITPSNELPNLEISESIINIRELYSRILSLEENTGKICNKSDAKLQEYYETGDKSLIGLSNTQKTQKVSAYIQALLDIIGSKGEMMDNLKIYLMHVIPAVAFLVIAILCIPIWFICCFCCCCNCCCCCCCKKPGCRFPCFIIVLALDAVLVVSCIYGLANSNKVFVGISNTGCSVLKFMEEITNGETKQTGTRWSGIGDIQDFLNDLSRELDSISDDTITDLNNNIEYINKNKSVFEAAKTDTCNYVNNETDVGGLVATLDKIKDNWLIIYKLYGQCENPDTQTFSYLLNKELVFYF